MDTSNFTVFDPRRQFYPYVWLGRVCNGELFLSGGLTFETFLVLSAVLCCSDTVGESERISVFRTNILLATTASCDVFLAAVASIKQQTLPAAHAVVFGEGVMNDVVSIILSQSLIGVAQMRAAGEIVELPTSKLVSELMVDVTYYLLTSSFVGYDYSSDVLRLL